MTGPLERVARAISDRYLKPYIERVYTTASASLMPKQIHDTVWGTILLTPLEVVLVDSPLVQRLRHLRQLGVAQWVYPSAGHTRFEHSLGVAHQAQQLMAAINRSSEVRYGKTIISNEEQTIIRAAALLHDIGHPVLSHVSEYALEVDPRTLLELQRQRRTLGEDVKLSEIVAALVVRSEEFSEVLKIVFAAHARGGLPTAIWQSRIAEFTDKVAKCILGQSISQEVPLLHQVISGPFDADKLDYMVRDSYMAGIPGIIDISRLVQKVMVQRVATTDLPAKLSSKIPAKMESVYLVGFPWSGLSVVDELLLTKMILFSKLYQHPKVVAIEAMILALVTQLSKLASNADLISFVYDVLDDELILTTRTRLLDRLGLKEEDITTEEQSNAVTTAVELLQRLRDRNLFVRAFAFSAHSPESQETPQETSTQATVELVKRLSDRAALEEFRQKIVAELRVIIELLEMQNALPAPDPSSLVVIRKKALPSQEELRRAYIFPSQGRPKTFGETGIHKDAWSSSFVSAAPKGYIFAPKELAAYVCVATEMVVAEEFGIAVPEWLMEEAKQSSQAIRPIKLQLRERGYYATRHRCVRPVIDRLLMADAARIIDDFADRFSGVQASVSEYAQSSSIGGATAMKQRARDWLDQFEGENVDCALDLLSRSKLLGRQDVVAMMSRFLTENPTFRNASVIGLSQGNESSQIVQYYAADVAAGLNFYPSLREAAQANKSGPVIFLDDFCASGGQVQNILGSWFDEPDLKRPGLKEQRTLALEPEREYLRGRNVAFCFVAGWKAGIGDIRSAIEKVGIKGVVFAHLLDESIPTAFENSDIDADKMEQFRQKCRSLGEKLLQDEGWDAEKIGTRSLGYGNRALLLFFPYNAPAQSLTCMWKSGTADGDSWLPLIPRRKKILD
ncbi:HD domain-containing protein [Rhizobium leguminosarum]|uniref:phosphoribosyltransferase-like protein n=1 Tax=Rhizobium leguminosarum TaxID=384 RepID=UPI001C96C100|nr:HD domain-containing protein [Rhizobium leguminosarum]MBY5329230.1 HD domain-containing protein [Rhizobium leguminosarum]